MMHSRQWFILFAALCTCLVSFSVLKGGSSIQDAHLDPRWPEIPAKGHNDVQNETLGFQEVFVISLPSRTDKKDTFALQAALSSIKYTEIDGVDGQTVPIKALPHVSERGANLMYSTTG